MLQGGLAKRERMGLEAYDFSPSSLFQPDALTPAQYLETFKRKTYLEGEKKLLFAVLEDAVVSFQKFCLVRDRKGKEHFKDVEDWMRGEKEEDWLFSFNTVCELLEINADYLRRGLLEWKARALSEGLRKGKAAKGVKQKSDLLRRVGRNRTFGPAGRESVVRLLSSGRGRRKRGSKWKS